VIAARFVFLQGEQGIYAEKGFENKPTVALIVASFQGCQEQLSKSDRKLYQCNLCRLR